YCVQTAEGQADLARTVLMELTKEKTPTSPKKGWYAVLDDLSTRLKPPQLTMTLKGLSKPGQLDVTDEQLIKLHYDVEQGETKGYPVVRIWSTTRGSGTSNMLLHLKNKEFPNFPHHFSQANQKDDVIFENPFAREDAGELGVREGQLRSMALYRGHYFQDESS